MPRKKKPNEIVHDLQVALDPVAFARSIDITPDPWQQEVLRSDAKRVILCCSRQSGKSTASALKALHMALYTPKSLILLTSPSERQSRELFHKIHDCINAMKTQPILTEDNKLSFTLVNGSRVLSLPADPATVRGYSAVSMILLDEAAQVDDAYYSAIQPMLAVSHGQLILMSTPFGKTGFFFREWVSGGDYWKRYQVTATDCPRISEEFLMQQKQSQGELFYRQEYLCEFVDTETQTFKHELLTSAIDETIEPLEL